MAVNITQLTAVYAAIVSSAVATWTFYRDWRDTGRLKVTVRFSSILHGDMIEENLIVYHMTNVGRRSVLLTDACGTTTNESVKDHTNFLVNDPALPKRLEPGDYHMTFVRDYERCYPMTGMYARDSLGRCFYAARSEVQEVNAKLKELAEQRVFGSRTRPIKSGTVRPSPS